MIFEIFGYIFSSFVIAIFVSWKFTRDICPYVLKKLLNRLVLQNWTAHRPTRLVKYDPLHSKCIGDVGIFPVVAETELEKPVKLQTFNASDELLFYGIDETGNGLLVKISRFYGDLATCTLYLFLDGKTYSVIRHGTSYSSPHEFSLGNLKLELVEPMRIWRIWYNGVLSCKDSQSQSPSTSSNAATCDAVHAVINLLWKPLDGPFDTQKDVNIELLAEYLGRNGNFGSNFSDLSSKILPDGYSQFGICEGTLKVNGVEQIRSLYGFRKRTFDNWDRTLKSTIQKMRDPAGHESRIELFGICDANGNAFHLTGRHDGWTDGHTLYSSVQRHPILSVDVKPLHFTIRNDAVLPKYFIIKDKTRSFHIEVWPKVQTCNPCDTSAQPRTCNFESVDMTLLKLTINGVPARGILLRTRPESNSSDRCTIQEHFLNKFLQTNSFKLPVPTGAAPSISPEEVVPFHSPACTNVELVGGKGASLSKLAALSKNMSTIEFGTANGFCVTTALFSTALKEHEPMIKSLLNSSDGTTNLENICKKVIEVIKSANAGKLIAPHVNRMLAEIFGESEKMSTRRFAVRSSGVLEDLLELSAAGQNETFLNVPAARIPEKVIKCWASMFTAQSVQYRLNHGQPIWSQMGVVIQEMVHARSAGVLFTADPRTGSPFELIINSNFGLGESVVSGAAEPDTIILKRANQLSTISGRLIDIVSICEKKLGSKRVQIQSSPDTDFTREVSHTSQADMFSLSDELALQLGKIGMYIEESLGNWKPVDIEWAIDENGKIIILQSRAMTALDAWTEYELIHEQDSGARTNHEVLTTANTGEVMPGATSPLGLSVTTRILDLAICCRLAFFNYDERIIPYISRTTNILRQRLLLNVLNTAYRQVDQEIGPPLAGVELTIFGHRLDTATFHKMGAERYGFQPTLKKLMFLPKAIYCTWESLQDIKRAVKKYGKYSTNIDLEKTEDPKILYEQLSERLFDLLDIGVSHCNMSQVSSFTNLFAFLTLASGKNVDEWDAELYEDISKILTVGINVESADIPRAIDELATVISKNEEIGVEKFINASAADAYELLLKVETLKCALEKFFEKHGHRSYAELDFYRQSWQTEPLPLITLLQTIVNNKVKYPDSTSWSTGQRYSNVDELLDSLNTKISPGSRRFLRFILKYCGNAVRNRETTKSLLVRTAVELKRVYNHLAKLLVKERLIKDPKLIYFMTHHEIGLVIGRAPSISKILTKAMRRMKIYPELNKEEFPEIMHGRFDPTADTLDENIELGDSIQATPLSSGKVQAIVKVCSSVDEASKLLEPGDILITHGTDIAWSPFFPMLGGIVTELGGLMSHGAVVAREYGLPCVVGAVNATKIFKTGEKVILDARNGTVTKVKTK